ncbi:MAG: 3-deoxy-7-phosphoheptulonate synthase [Candidatus Tectimicrobiota bacterium]|nr:MAG: 3-deoxy-7-phosphoheptulonate synthase [Candidatus Tectomicrobia bacterium]
MIVVMKAGAEAEKCEAVMREIARLGYKPHPIVGVERTVIAAVGDERGKAALQALEGLPGVEKVVPILKPYKLASRLEHRERTVITVQGVAIGGPEVVVMAGPCTVESYEQVYETAVAVKAAGARILRGGAFKPRTSPYSFQGLEEVGLRILQQVGKELGLPIVTECMNPEDAELVAAYADIIQIGARNVQNFSLLKRVGRLDVPVLLKRGMSTTIEELLLSAEYILSAGNPRVILCERGIRTFEKATRNTLDLSAVPVLHAETHLPVIVDPSHATGHWQYVTPMAKAAIAAGADGLLVEVHPHPAQALCDGPQSLKPATFCAMMRELAPVARAVGRQL